MQRTAGFSLVIKYVIVLIQPMFDLVFWYFQNNKNIIVPYGTIFVSTVVKELIVEAYDIFLN